MSTDIIQTDKYINTNKPGNVLEFEEEIEKSYSATVYKTNSGLCSIVSILFVNVWIFFISVKCINIYWQQDLHIRIEIIISMPGG